MWQLVESLNVFNSLTLKQVFWKTKAFLEKLGYRFLDESTKIKNPSFRYKTALSEANVKTNRTVNTKSTYHKERSFTSDYFIFLKILFQFKNLLQRVDLIVTATQMPIFVLFVIARVLFDGASTVWVLNWFSNITMQPWIITK